MVKRCMKISTGQEYAAKIINTKKLSARGEFTQLRVLYGEHKTTGSAEDGIELLHM